MASGDLSAEVRVWDISDPNNGYESWQHEVNGSNPHSKISISLTFHPFDNVLLIGKQCVERMNSEKTFISAVQNELRIWDWSQKDPLRPNIPTAPFVTIKTNSEREKISYIRKGFRFFYHFGYSTNRVAIMNRIKDSHLWETS